MEILVYLLIGLPFIVITIVYVLIKNKRWFLKYPVILLCGWLGYRLQLVILLSTISEPSALITNLIELEKLYINTASWIPTLIFLVILQIINMIYIFTRNNIISNKTKNLI